MQTKINQTPLLKLIVQMSLPAMLSMLISALYNVVDSIFVAQLGEYALTAVSLAFPIQSLIIAVAVGTGVGLSSFISRCLGQKEYKNASIAANHAIFLGLAIGLVFALVGVFLTKPFFRMFTSDPLIIENGCSYTYIVTIFSFGVTTQLNIEKVIQSAGDMISSMLIVLLGAITNIILDPIFIFGYFGVPAMGVAGAAIATVIGQIASMVLALVFLYKKKYSGLTITRPYLRPDFKILKRVFSVGVPAIVMQSLSSALVLLMNWMLILFSPTAVTVMGIYFKLQMFVFMPVFGISQGVRPIMGYLHGANDMVRLKKALKNATQLALGIMLTGTVVFCLFAPLLMQPFNPTPEMQKIGVDALRIISVSFVFAGANLMISTYFQSCGYGKSSLVVSLMRELVFIIPLAYLLGQVWGLSGIWLSFALAEGLCLVVALWLYRFMTRKKPDVSLQDG